MSPATLAVLVFAFASADDPKPPAAPKERLAAIRAENEAAQTAYFKAAKAIPDTPEGNKKSNELWKAFDKAQADRFSAAVEIAESEPKSEAGLAALEWVLTTPRSYYLPVGIPAMQLAAEHHADNPKVGRIIASLGCLTPHEGSASRPAAMELIRAVAEKNPDRTARGQAVAALAMQARRRFDIAEYKKAANIDALAAEAEKAFEAVIKDYGDCRRLVREGKGTLGDAAKLELFELRNLRIGKVIPDLEGEDLDGVKFKLSDSRGKIRLVVFWAGWCGPCMEMVPQERKLAEKYKDKPFVIIGVNGDDDREKAKKLTVDKEMTWRSMWAGPKGPDGPICHAWNISHWPTVYVLDGDGVIRAKDVRMKDLDEALERLLGGVKK